MEHIETVSEENQHGASPDGKYQNQSTSNGHAQSIIALVGGIVGIALGFVPFIGIGGSITGIHGSDKRHVAS